MSPKDGPARTMAVVRLIGLGVILFVALIAAPTDSTASASCPEYTVVEECVADEWCLDWAEKPCAGPTGCSGHYACAFAETCPSVEPMALLCYFGVH